MLLLVAAVGYLAFAVMFSIHARNFSIIKLIYLLPALPALAAAFELGGAQLLAWGAAGSRPAAPKARQTAVRAVALALVLLFFGYITDLGALTAQLAESRAAGVPPCSMC